MQQAQLTRCLSTLASTLVSARIQRRDPWLIPWIKVAAYEPTPAPVASFTCGESSDQNPVSRPSGEHNPEAVVTVPPRFGKRFRTPCAHPMKMITERNRMVWKASAYSLRAKIKASIGQYRRVIGNTVL